MRMKDSATRVNCSWSGTRRRTFMIQAKLRSATQRRRMTVKPLAPGGRFRISMVRCAIAAVGIDRFDEGDARLGPAERALARPTVRVRIGDQRRDQLPLTVGQVGAIRSPLRRLPSRHRRPFSTSGPTHQKSQNGCPANPFQTRSK